MNESPIHIPCAFSPCPNDTYLFYAWVHGYVGKGFVLEPTLADIQTLNEKSMQGRFSLTKLSMAAYPKVWEQYQLLPVGMAFSDGEGPRLIGLPGIETDNPSLAIQGKRIAVPGLNTTAFLALRILYGESFAAVPCSYHEILSLVKSGEVDYGLLIHETRTHFTHEGVVQLADLGQAWKARFDLPLPLGGLALKRDLYAHLPYITRSLSESLEFVRRFPEKALPYILQHAQEEKLEVIAKHLSLYVTSETQWVTERAKEGLIHFFRCGENLGWWGKLPKEWIWEKA